MTMNEKKWGCVTDKVVQLARERPICPRCGEPMVEERRQAQLTRRLGRCCLGKR